MKFFSGLFFIHLFCIQNIIVSSSEDKGKQYIYIKPLKQILSEHSNIDYIKALDAYQFDYFPFFNSEYVTTGVFGESFILTIPQGNAQGIDGNVLIQNSFIEEMLWAQKLDSLNSLRRVDAKNIIKINGKLAVLAQPAAHNYCHFIHEVLGRLALLEMNGVEYDYVYLSFLKKFMKELLILWGIDLDKILYPIVNESSIQADLLIVPSLVINSTIGFTNAGFRPNPVTSEYVRNKLLQAVLKLGIDTSNFSKKVFISRKDAPQRKILNEDDIFALFEPYGFVRYELSKLTIAQQILLMNQAEMVVGEHGAGLTNVLFCKPNILVIEIFQKLIDNSNWWVANIAKVNYIPVDAMNQDVSWAADWKSHGNRYSNAWAAKTVVPLDKIQEVIEKYLN
jgi:hypothetical protein